MNKNFLLYFFEIFLYSPGLSKMTVLYRSEIIKTAVHSYNYILLLLSFYTNFLGKTSSTFCTSFFRYFKKIAIYFLNLNLYKFLFWLLILFLDLTVDWVVTTCFDLIFKIYSTTLKFVILCIWYRQLHLHVNYVHMLLWYGPGKNFSRLLLCT